MLILSGKSRKVKMEQVPIVEPEQRCYEDVEQLPHPFASPVPLSKNNIIDST